MSFNMSTQFFGTLCGNTNQLAQAEFSSFGAYSLVISGFQCCAPLCVVDTPFKLSVYCGANISLPEYFEV